MKRERMYLYVLCVALVFILSACSNESTSPNLPSKVSAPVFSVAGGSYDEPQTVTISCSTVSAQIYYTTDGTDPGSNATLYLTPIVISETTTLKAIAIRSGWTDSDVSNSTYHINMLQVATPEFSLAEGIYDTIQSVSISCATADATIYYTMDGSIPSIASLEYSVPIILTTTQTIRAIALKPNMLESQLVSKVYTINVPCTFFGNFALTDNSYSDTISWSQKINELLGPYYRIVDWNDLVNYHGAGNDLGAVFDGFGLTAYLVDVGLLCDNEQFWGSRAYGCNRANGVVPSGYLLHDHINNYQFLLGSWSPSSRRLLAIKTYTK